MRRSPTAPCLPWSAPSTTSSRFETSARSYAAAMRSQARRPRIHTRPRGYCAGVTPSPSGARTLSTGRISNVKLVEPPSCSSPSAIVFIGKNRRGNWVAQEQNGLYGGLFVNRAQAVKYALFENGHHPETIIELSRGIELDMGPLHPAQGPPISAP